MKLEIHHTTRYTYENPACDSINEIRLTPRTNYRQSCYLHSITTEPATSLFAYTDFFGNRVHSFSLTQSHRSLAIHVHSIVVTQNQEPRSSGRLKTTEEQAILADRQFQNRYAEFLLATSFVPFSTEIHGFAREVADTCRNGSVYEMVRCLSRTIHQGFAYQPGATTVTTTAQDALCLKGGVCQDFAHLMIACCRMLGIPARYISGYHFVGDLQTPAAGFEQASHAWVEAMIPGVGWLGFDPTNDGTMNWRYVKLGHGRDYNDIVPVKGSYKSLPGERTMEVTVDVRQVEDESAMTETRTTTEKIPSVFDVSADIQRMSGAPQ